MRAMTDFKPVDPYSVKLGSALELPGCTLPNRLALAPLAGSTDVVFRSLCREQGAGLVVSELISARGIVHDSDFIRNFRYLEIDPAAEHPVAIQLFGFEPEDFSRAVHSVLSHPLFGQCALIDLNLGCPVNKVVRQGSGSALMRDPQRAGAVMQAAVKAAAAYGKAVSVKIRSGWDRDSVNAAEIARRAEQAGICLITVHARTREQMYAGEADWSVIADVVSAVHVPVFGNGDVTDRAGCLDMLRRTGCDGVMIGRAAQGNPWIFARILEQAAPPSEDQRVALIERHLDAAIVRRLEKTAIREMRTHLAAYLKGCSGAAEMRRRIMTCETKAEIMQVLRGEA